MTEALEEDRLLVDLQTEEYTTSFSQAPLYEKTALVRIRKAKPGDAITTRLADGTTETTNVAEENQVIITNPGGEEYLLDEAKAFATHVETEQPGLYKETQLIRAIDNPTGQEVSIMAPWGDEQIGAADCKFASPHDPTQPDLITAERYIIGGEEFLATYAPVVDSGTQPVVENQVAA